jgi:hypothetical protein
VLAEDAQSNLCIQLQSLTKGKGNMYITLDEDEVKEEIRSRLGAYGMLVGNDAEHCIQVIFNLFHDRGWYVAYPDED